MSMEIVSVLLLLLVMILLPDPAVSQGPCSSPASCSQDGPKIRFPFRLKDQPKSCGYPGFDLECKGKDTVLNLPYSGETVVVKSIFYALQTLYVDDPKKCAAAVFLNLHLSSSPFGYIQKLGMRNYTILNCSKEFNSHDFRRVGCLSDAVYVVESSLSLAALPKYCIKRLSMPLTSYDDGGVIGLSWDVPPCGKCEEAGGKCGFEVTSSLQIECYDVKQRSHGSSTFRLDFVLVPSSGCFVLLFATLMGFKMYYCWCRPNGNEDIVILVKVEEFLANYKSMKPTRYSYDDIRRMTQKFKDKLGEGGYGSVFKGVLPNGSPAAVKVLKILNDSNGEEFINEVGTIGRIHHVNVVRLLGFCAEGPKRALIYEFMPNESLEKYISTGNANNPFILGWEKLQDIAVGIAKGMEYLHQGCNQRILHFDIKPRNILLDHNCNPKISDFGLAKLCSKGQSIVSMTIARGTAGYIAPEVISMNFGNVSHKSDVYSFGVLLLEMVGGRKNTESSLVGSLGQERFPEWIYNFPHQGEEFELRITVDGDAKIARKLTIVALWCMQWYPADRPSMKSAVQMLEGDSDSLTMPPNPFSFMSLPTEGTTTHMRRTGASSEI